MKPAAKVGVVVGGYLVAALVAFAAVAIHRGLAGSSGAEASGGMAAFGDLLLFAALFGVIALLPTGAALVFLRSHRSFWIVLSGVALMVAVTGLASAIVFAAGRHAAGPSLLATWATLAVPRILAAPLLALGFLVSAIASPQRSFRMALLVATGADASVSAYGAFVWLVPSLLGGS